MNGKIIYLSRMTEEMKIVFMGTPDFAVASLQSILNEKFNVVGVITATDKPAGRGKKLKSSAVKQFALENDLPVLQPKNLKAPDFIAELKALEADLFVVVAFRMLPEVVWAMPPRGTINLHASLLPNYRGAAPINWAIINGETETGVSTFFIEKEIDTGQIIHQDRVRILPAMTAGELHDELSKVGARLLSKTVSLIHRGEVKATPQIFDPEKMKKAPKLFKDDCRINWHRKGQEVHNFIRGLSPYPTAWSLMKGVKVQSVKILRAQFQEEKHEKAPGTIRLTKRSMEVACLDGWINLLEIVPQGKSKMNIQAYLNGQKPDEEAKFD